MVIDTFDRVPPYGLLHNWLGIQTINKLLDIARASEHLFREAKVGHAETRIDHTRRRSRRLQNLGEFAGEIEAKMREILPTIFAKLGNTPFIPCGFEVELVAHSDGAYYTRHIDTLTQIKDAIGHRVVSAVYYFHAQPKGFTGGALRLYSLSAGSQSSRSVDIEPDNDTLVFFPSWFPHEVLPVKCPSGRFLDSRFAINCWILRS